MKKLINCPICGGKTLGKVGSNQFYCRECFMEFSKNKNKIIAYEVADDGSLLPYENKLENADVKAGN